MSRMGQDERYAEERAAQMQDNSDGNSRPTRAEVKEQRRQERIAREEALRPQQEVVTSPDAAVMNHIAEVIEAINVDKGFRGTWEDALNERSSDRQAEILSTKLMLTVSELSEALETLRDHGAMGVMAGEGNFGEELADAVIRIFDLAQMVHVPIGDEVVRKLLKNMDRPSMHGRQF
jgi:NTP pyrophosphatase (non-canonical NTP hydrolase)